MQISAEEKKNKDSSGRLNIYKNWESTLSNYLIKITTPNNNNKWEDNNNNQLVNNNNKIHK